MTATLNATLSPDARAEIRRLERQIEEHEYEIEDLESEASRRRSDIEDLEDQIREVRERGAMIPGVGTHLEHILTLAEWAEADDLPLYDWRDVEREVRWLASQLEKSDSEVADAVSRAERAVWIGDEHEDVIGHVREALWQWEFDQRWGARRAAA